MTASDQRGKQDTLEMDAAASRKSSLGPLDSASQSGRAPARLPGEEVYESPVTSYQRGHLPSHSADSC